MSLLRFIICIVAAVSFASASPPSATSSSLSPSETPFVVSESATCLNRTYIYCSHHDLTGDYKNDITAAVVGLDHFCSIHMVSPNQYYRTIWGTSQIYHCNYAGMYKPCSSAEYWAADAMFDEHCGQGKGGWMYRETDDSRWSVGRDPTQDDGNFRSECGKW
ncbi:hypothetical protein Daus18300_008185 [Diaporthe australafricana]|uniref:Uncharacterized protein n=1 Tax=Diaporthe australafricana TaxID=127596 RepID=A0ABR3WJ92_9PEZI